MDSGKMYENARFIIHVFLCIIKLEKNLEKIGEDMAKSKMEEEEYLFKEENKRFIICKNNAINEIKKFPKKDYNQLDYETNLFKNQVDLIMEELLKNDDYFLSLHQLNCLYFMYKFILNKKEENLKQVEELVTQCIFDIDEYNNILIELGLIVKEAKAYKEKIEHYFQMIYFLDVQQLNNNIASFLLKNSIKYSMPEIQLPDLKNQNNEDYDKLEYQLKYIANVLKIINESKTALVHERFIYYEKYKGNEEYLDIINLILSKKGKKPLKSLIQIDNEVNNEFIAYLQNRIDEQDDELLKMKNGYKNLKDLSKEYISKCEQLENDLENAHNYITSLKDNIQKKKEDKKQLAQKVEEQNNIIIYYEKRKNELEEIKQVYKKKFEKEEKKSLGAKCRDVDRKIINYFYFSLSEEDRKKIEDSLNKDKKVKEKKSPSYKKKIRLIMENLKNKFNNYYSYMFNNKIDIEKVLSSLLNQKDFYNDLVHDLITKEEYIKSKNEFGKNSLLGDSLEFLFGSSKLIEPYVFEKENDWIYPDDIYNEFVELNKSYGNIDS